MALYNNDSPALTDEKYSQYSSFPVRYPKLVKQYDDLEAVLWTEKELRFHDDVNHMRTGLMKNPAQEERAKNLLLYISGFFLFADGLITLSVGSVLQSIITVREILDFYALQAYNETIHNKFYSTTMESLFPGKREEMQTNLPKYPGIQGKIAWAEKWIKPKGDKRPSVQQLVVANVIIESEMFTPSFGIIYLFKRLGKLPAVTDGNDMVSRDENMHRTMGCSIYALVEPEYRLPQSIIHDMIKEAVVAEKAFVFEGMGGESLEGFPLEDALKYTEYIADLLAADLGYEKIYNTPNPCPWILMMSLEPKKNFFEKQVTEYQKDRTSKNKNAGGFDFSDDPSY